jgi:hypothetical protein
MSEAGLGCAWRRPDDVNVTVFQGYDGEQHVHKQYVFGDDYVYTENGIVTALQQ